jgi:hypothetical protein
MDTIGKVRRNITKQQKRENDSGIEMDREKCTLEGNC